MTSHLILLDPDHPGDALRHLAAVCDLESDTLDVLGRIIPLLPHPARLVIDADQADLYQALVLADKFTFDLDSDLLIVFATDPDTLIDALIEMAMYLSGFSTMLGSAEAWVTLFAAGAWKPVKNQIKRQLDLPVSDKPQGVVGLPPAPDTPERPDPYPFRTLVSSYDRGSFDQMVLLAGRDEVAVYFPPDAHPKVLAVYVYMRRAMQEVAQGLGLADYETFNVRLIEALQRMEPLFSPSTLSPAQPIAGVDPAPDERRATGLLGLFPQAGSSAPDPFEAFIEQLFPDEDSGEEGR